MHELLNIKTGKTIRFASQVGEFKPDEYLFYVILFLKQLSGELTDPHEIKRQLFVKLVRLKMGWRMWFYKQETREAVWCALSEKIDLLDSFFEITTEEDGHRVFKMIHPRCGYNLLSEWNGLKGPKNMLMNLAWGEFIQCLDCMKQIQLATTNEDYEVVEELSEEMMRVLYKTPPLRSSPLLKGTLRKTSALRARPLKPLRFACPIKPLPLKGTPLEKGRMEYGAVMFHCITYFSYVYELITTVEIPYKGNEIPFYIIWQKDEDDDDFVPENDLTEWDGILFSLAESGAFGTTENVNGYNMWDILLYLYKQKHAGREERRRMKLMKTNP